MGTGTKRAKMFAVVEAWERSGMSRSEYADRHGLSYGTLYYWCQQRELAREALAVVARDVPSEPFVSLSADFGGEIAAALGVIVITLASGTRIEVR